MGHLAGHYSRLPGHSWLAQKLVAAGESTAVAADRVEAFDLSLRYRTSRSHPHPPWVGADLSPRVRQIRAANTCVNGRETTNDRATRAIPNDTGSAERDL